MTDIQTDKDGTNDLHYDHKLIILSASYIEFIYHVDWSDSIINRILSSQYGYQDENELDTFSVARVAITLVDDQ